MRYALRNDWKHGLRMILLWIPSQLTASLPVTSHLPACVVTKWLESIDSELEALLKRCMI